MLVLKLKDTFSHRQILCCPFLKVALSQASKLRTIYNAIGPVIKCFFSRKQKNSDRQLWSGFETQSGFSCRIGDAVFLTPKNLEIDDHSKTKSPLKEVDKKLYPEYYRKSFKGSSLFIPFSNHVKDAKLS